ncbi:MAG: DUF5702 domain-containing protein [Mobilitalea sp.]
MNRIHKRSDASITIYLSLILLIILSLLFTIIESARVNTAKIYAERALTTAMDSVLAGYYGPLWEEYHLFGLNTGNGTQEEKQSDMMDRLSEYMSYTFEPNKEINQQLYKDRTEIYDISIDSLNISDQTMLMDYQGELLINEAVEYMKYKEVGDIAEALLNKASLLETPKKVSFLYEEKQKVEEELVEIDEGILELMELLDGLKTNKKGIERNKNGTVKAASNFIKQIVTREITMEGVGVNQEDVFLALRDSYCNPFLEINELSDKFSAIEQGQQSILKIQKEINAVVSLLAQDETTLQSLEAIEKKSKAQKQLILRIGENIGTLKKQETTLGDQVLLEQENINGLVEEINKEEQELSTLVGKIKPLIAKAVSTIDNIIKKSGSAASLISQYTVTLQKEQDGIDDDIYSGLEDSLSELTKYTSEGEGDGNYANMKVILLENQETLGEISSLLGKAEADMASKSYLAAQEDFINIGTLFKEYQIEDLTIDYSTLVLNQTEQENPVDAVKSIFQTGITGLVINSNTISNKTLTSAARPSDIAAASDTDTDYLVMLSSFFENVTVSGKNSGKGSLFGSFGTESGVMEGIGDAVNKVAEQVLYQEYLKEHFSAFPMSGEDLTVRKPSVLIYEQEYLLAGKSSDTKNLSSIITRVVFLRTILDFASILGDKTKCSEAKVVAAGLVGFTGLPILIGITQTLILLVWAFDEALLDTCALMMGKEVPLLKKQIVLQFSDLFLINYEFLKAKSAQIVSTKNSSFSYQDYLRLFLLLKKKKDLSYRSMDLMQENINLRYADGFKFVNCMFGFRTEAKFLIATKFTSANFMQEYISGVDNFSYTTEAEYSY